MDVARSVLSVTFVVLPALDVAGDLVRLVDMAATNANLEGSIVGHALHAGRFSLLRYRSREMTAVAVRITGAAQTTPAATAPRART